VEEIVVANPFLSIECFNTHAIVMYLIKLKHRGSLNAHHSILNVNFL